MTRTAVSKESIRNYCQDGREFVIRYEFESHTNPEAYLIRAHLKEIQTGGQYPETTSSVELLCPYRELGEKLFDLINNAPDPVFPIHLPEIVRDQISCTLLDNVRFTLKTSPL
ncbi:MAG TPA: hypothetical protein GX529_03320 [Firmicutes bacterium]|nr:hypothetical protein [Candidatus Fermentithermobacillaceae bacterium]